MVSDWIIGECGYFLYLRSILYEILEWCATFKLSSMNKHMSWSPVLQVLCRGHWWFLTEYLGYWYQY